MVKDFERIFVEFVKDFLGVCYEKGSDGNFCGMLFGIVIGNIWGVGCVYVGEIVMNLKDSIVYFGD